MLKKIGLSLIIAFPLIMAGCAAMHPVSSEATHVLVSQNPPAKTCKYLGQAVGKPGSSTYNKNLDAGALNDMRNQAVALGGNYIQTLGNHASVTGNNGQLTKVVYTGNVYRCPQLQ